MAANASRTSVEFRVDDRMASATMPGQGQRPEAERQAGLTGMLETSIPRTQVFQAAT